MAGHDYTLYSYFCSSCAARVRIALNVKSIGYDIVPVRMAEDEHLSDAHRALNPSCTVPLLVCHAARRQNFRIGQSVAALEYLDETHPSTPLLPPASDPETRAAVRMLVGIVCCDIQPVTNLRIKRRVGKLGGDAEQWNRELMVDGLRAYEGVAREWAGRYSVGDEITLADVCFMPAWWNAERVGAELGEFELCGNWRAICRRTRPLWLQGIHNSQTRPRPRREGELPRYFPCRCSLACFTQSEDNAGIEGFFNLGVTINSTIVLISRILSLVWRVE